MKSEENFGTHFMKLARITVISWTKTVKNRKLQTNIPHEYERKKNIYGCSDTQGAAYAMTKQGLLQ